MAPTDTCRRLCWRPIAAMAFALWACAPSPSATPKRSPGKAMRRAAADGVELEYQVQGNGDPVLLIHGGVFADWYGPLLQEPALADRYRLIRYHRAGYGGSGRVAGALPIAQQASQLNALMQQLGITRAHIVGHSSGGNIALQLALDAPQRVQSLALLEPALTLPPSGAAATAPPPRNAAIAAVFDAYRGGHKDAAIDAFLRLVAGPHYRPALNRALPGWHEQALADADAFFAQELPAVQQWSFTRDDAARITQPVLAVIGQASPAVSPLWQQRQQLLLSWLPQAEPFVLPGATHLLHVQNPRAMAVQLSAFLARHPIAEPR